MSADNYLWLDVVEGSTDDAPVFTFYNASASIAAEGGHPSTYTSPIEVFDDVFEAYDACYKWASEHVVEYGVQMSRDFIVQLAAAAMVRDAMKLKTYAAEKRNKAVGWADIHGWAFVEDHALDIAKVLMAQEEGESYVSFRQVGNPDG